MEDCLTNLFKLSRTTCTCFDEGKPTDYNEGKFDVYLDELEGFELNMLAGASDCSSGSLWDIMAWARDEAAKQFKADLLACINQNYVSRRSVYSGLIGQISFTGNLNLTHTKAGQILIFPQIKGGKMTLRRIATAFNTTGTIDVEVYDNAMNQTTPIASYTLNTTANTAEFSTLSTPLELPMWSNLVKHLEYYIVYTRGTKQPKDVQTDCGCGGTPPPWKTWMSVYGISGSDTSYGQWTRVKKFANGLLLDVDLRCKATDLICSDERPLDIDNSGFDMQVVYANRWLAGALTFQKILDSPNLSRYTLMDRERIYGMRNHARARYNEFITYLCENTEVSSGCLMCKQNPNFSMGNILA